MPEATPRILHQTWKTDSLPDHLREFQASWLALHPDWEYRLWTDEDNERLIAEHYPQFLDHYRHVTPIILKIDFVRLAYLHRFGGVYADIDCEALRSFEPLIRQNQIIVAREHQGIGRILRGRDFVINALLISPPGHPFWLGLMQRMVSEYRPRRRSESYVGYVIRMAIALLDAEVEAHPREPDDLVVLPHEAFYPSPPSERLVANRRVMAAALNSYAIHHYEDSWFRPLAKFLNRVVQACQLLKRKLTAPKASAKGRE